MATKSLCRSLAAAAAALMLAPSAWAQALRVQYKIPGAAVNDNHVRPHLRIVNGTAAGQALLKTGSLEGVRALAGYVLDPTGTRWIVVALVNHANAARTQPALDFLAQWVYSNAATYAPPAGSVIH